MTYGHTGQYFFSKTLTDIKMTIIYRFIDIFIVCNFPIILTQTDRLLVGDNQMEIVLGPPGGLLAGGQIFGPFTLYFNFIFRSDNNSNKSPIIQV